MYNIAFAGIMFIFFAVLIAAYTYISLVANRGFLSFTNLIKYDKHFRSTFTVMVIAGLFGTLCAGFMYQEVTMTYKGNSTAKKKVDGDKYRKRFDEIFNNTNRATEIMKDFCEKLKRLKGVKTND